jgi:hypothetical protein
MCCVSRDLFAQMMVAVWGKIVLALNISCCVSLVSLVLMVLQPPLPQALLVEQRHLHHHKRSWYNNYHHYYR